MVSFSKLSCCINSAQLSQWLNNGPTVEFVHRYAVFTCEEFGDSLVLSPCGTDEQQPGRQELVMTGQELSDGPRGARGGPLVALAQLTAFVDGVHQQEEGLLGRLHIQQRQQDTSEERRIQERTDVTVPEFVWKNNNCCIVTLYNKQICQRRNREDQINKRSLSNKNHHVVVVAFAWKKKQQSKTQIYKEETSKAPKPIVLLASLKSATQPSDSLPVPIINF